MNTTTHTDEQGNTVTVTTDRHGNVVSRSMKSKDGNVVNHASGVVGIQQAGDVDGRSVHIQHR